MAQTTEGRVAYADLLRVAATLAVIVLHCCATWLQGSPVGSTYWNILNVFDSMVRWCVPVFVMLSGMFLLDPKKSVSLSSLFFNHILRSVVALVFWGTAYAFYDNWQGFNSISLPWVLSVLKSVLLGNTHYHLWFLYMIIGLYLLTPILRAFIKGASRRDLHYFLIFAFLAASLIPTLLDLRPSATLSLYYARLGLHFLAGYAGLYVAGYYLKTYTLGRITEFVIYLLGIAGTVVTICGTLVLSKQDGALSSIFYEYLSPNVVFMSVAVFVLFRYVLGVSEERSRRQRLGGVAKITFGIYLVHDFFLILLRHFGLLQPALTPLIAIPLMACAVFLCSFLVIWPISKIPFVGKYLT
ncbi:MAG: acyltransferase family protein [Oscillospiraceae bacterium]